MGCSVSTCFISKQKSSWNEKDRIKFIKMWNKHIELVKGNTSQQVS